MIGEILALSSALCYAIAAVLYKKALRTTGYFTTLLVSTLFAALFILMILPMTQHQLSRLTFNLIALIIIAEVIGLGIGDTLYFVGLKKIGVSRTISISSSYPLYSIILATLFLNEGLTIAVIVATPLIVAGIAIVSLSQNKERITASNSKVTLLGIISSIVAAVFWGIALTILKVVLNSGNVDPILVAFFGRLALLPLLLLVVIASGESGQLRRLTKLDITVFGIAGILSSGLGVIMLFTSLSMIDASIAIPLSSITPFISILLASFYIREKVGFKIIVGTSLIVTGIVLLIVFV